MRICVVGGGPAGLFFAYLMKRSFPEYRIRVVEQNAAGVTFGFGVVLSGRALSFISEGDGAAVVKRLRRRMESWSDQHIVHQGKTIAIDGSSYSAIARLALLEELQKICQECGVDIQFSHHFSPEDDAIDEDVVVAADGANSVIRDRFADGFGPRVSDLQNYFAWYGVAMPYPAHTLTFKSNDLGVFCGHHYRYAPSMSTFVAEVDAETWHTSGMAAMCDEQRKVLFENIFADTLRGNKLISNKSNWKRWRLIKNDRWSFRNVVLIGDAQRSAHPSIGSGTRLAMEDSIALWQAFCRDGNDIQSAFISYEKGRRPIRDKLNRAAELSIAWYEAMATKMGLSPYEFAFDYMMRTGVMTAERLRTECPKFCADYEKSSSAALLSDAL